MDTTQKFASQLQPGDLFWTTSGTRHRATTIRVTQFGTVRVGVGTGEIMFGPNAQVSLIHE